MEIKCILMSDPSGSGRSGVKDVQKDVSDDMPEEASTNNESEYEIYEAFTGVVTVKKKKKGKKISSEENSSRG